MRIDLISEHASPLAALGDVDAGGQNVHVAALAEGLAGRGHRVRVHTRRDDSDLDPVVRLPTGVEVVHVDAGPARRLPKDELWPHMDAFAEALARRWRTDPPDAAHAHFWMSGYAALCARSRTGVPVAMTFHALGAEKRRQQGAKDTSPPERIAVEAEIGRAADLVLATTAAERDLHIAAGATPGRVAVVPCGVDVDRFRPDPTAGPPAGAPLRVGIVSRLVERKGIGNVIEALVHLPGAELVVAGGPPADRLDDDPAVRRFRALAEALGVGDRVTLVGAVERTDVPALLRSVDVVACCPWYEPFGLVALEAMACGRPVVATAVGGLAETVVDGVTGRLVPPRDPRAIAGALGSLRAAQVRRPLGRAARSRACRYGWDRVARATEVALARIAAQAVAPAGSPA